jgi:predicted CoA-substrate-specific enzyme activase
VVETTFDPLAQCHRLIEEKSFDMLVATGYGRHLAQANFADKVITEIKAFALGCSSEFPECRTILDIGGQDTKAISVGPGGKVQDFQMNDRCAAGTGKFLEVMAAAMGLSLEEMGSIAMQTGSEVKISSMCTVFAESEVTGLIARGTPRPEIARGLHEAICDRASALLKRVGVEKEVVFAGGVARNPCLKALLEERLDYPLLVPDNPQIVGALGAALSVSDSNP